MPLQTDTYDLADEAERLKEECRETAEKLAPLDAENPAAPRLQRRGNQLQSQLDGVRWARSEWDVDAVTLGGLTGGEYGHVEDELPAAGGSGARRVYYVAKGTVDAPYLDDDMDFDARIAAASDLPIGFLRWAEARIDDLSSVTEGNEPRFADWLADARKEQSTDE
ncbi:hypothetical protein [Haloarcula sp. K1]|uniref:hypothetical protein n=1 Tax=Haloarcula sp. K1 TaxID=1622207 RepID=UPI0007BAF0E8|nr:hypothetical protein [Haloarcula sp. K1]KZX49299.1 hypothetical protein AV929_12200 [Haloarcula sp. K1]